MPSELLPISALQHFLFCERQCALIHLERLWAENQFTAEGRVMHERTHQAGTESRSGLRFARALPLRSEHLGLHGVADVVEFHLTHESLGFAPTNIRSILPVEYKRGKPKAHDADRVQICAQALCLEEMFGVAVPVGALFYGENRRRLDVRFDDALRATTQAATERLQNMIAAGATPPATREPKCEHCSLLDICLPDALRFRRGVGAWNERAFTEVLK
jgi:CRISPR-associated exonuclease Cas4